MAQEAFEALLESQKTLQHGHGFCQVAGSSSVRVQASHAATSVDFDYQTLTGPAADYGWIA
jgi:hypothetical protein